MKVFKYITIGLVYCCITAIQKHYDPFFPTLYLIFFLKVLNLQIVNYLCRLFPETAYGQNN